VRGIVEDIRFAFRLVAKSPAFTAIVVVTLALGIGGNTAIFSIVNSFLLRPLPFDRPEELVYLGEYYRDSEQPGVTSWVNFNDFRQQNTVFEDMAAWWSGVANLSGHGEPLRVNTAVVSPNYFALLGVQPTAEVPAAPEGIDDTASSNMILTIVRPMFANLVAELRRAVLFASSETRGGDVGQVYLMGDVARWPGAAELLSSLAQMRVTIPRPLPESDENDEHAAPMPELVVPAGLALRGYTDA